MSRGLLVRVGIDSTSGKWNAPIDCRTMQFMFVPIPDCPYNPTGDYIEGGRKTYGEVLEALKFFAKAYGQLESKYFQLPRILHEAAMHLDPDFENLTYGDDGRRGKKLKEFNPGDFIAFYAGLRSIQTGKLVYALIGMIELDSKPSDPAEVQEEERLRHAHCRWVNRRKGEVVVSGKRGSSGLLKAAIEIGYKNDKTYYVKPDIFDEWGGFQNFKNGYLQRSGTLPELKYPERFLEWLRNKKPLFSCTRYRVP